MRDEVFNDCMREQARGEKRFWPQLAEKWGYKNGEAIRAAFRRARKERNENGELGDDATYQETDDFINIVYANTPLKTKDDVIREYGIDMEKWKIDFFEVKPSQGYRKQRKVKWEVRDGKVIEGSVDDTGKMLVVQLYNLRIKFVPKTIDDIGFGDIETFMTKREFSLPSISSKKYSPSDEILEIDVMDTHFGSDANHSPEKRFAFAVDDVIERIGDRKFERIIVPLLGDIYHYDNVNRTTSAGTLVTTNNLTPYEVFDLGLTSIIENLLKLVQLAPLEIVFVPGNHDPMSGYTLVKVLEAYFKDQKYITVDSEHKSRKFRLIGKNLVGWMHGDMPKTRASQWLQIEASREWGKSEYREIHSGNFHSQQAKEDGGVILRYLPGMTNIDEWHYGKGFVGAVRAMVSFVWDKEKGLREQWFTNV